MDETTNRVNINKIIFLKFQKYKSRKENHKENEISKKYKVKINIINF